MPDIACKEVRDEQSRNKTKRRKFNNEQVEPKALTFSPQTQEKAKIQFPAKRKASDTTTGPRVECPWDRNEQPMRRDFIATTRLYNWVMDPMNSNDRYQLQSIFFSGQMIV